jgi:hypothetical protein
MSKEGIMLEEEFVTVRITLTFSPATERLGTTFLATEIGIGPPLGSVTGANNKNATGRTNTVNQGVLKPTLRKMNAYAIARYARTFLVTVISLPSALEPFLGSHQLLKPGQTRAPMR